MPLLDKERKQWVLGESHLEEATSFASQLGISTLTATLLLQRGFHHIHEVKSFLSPSLKDLHDPSLLPDFESAVKCILKAREKGDTIFIHGDYDVDGITSTALLTRFLKSIGCNVIPHVPHRVKEGYGIHLSAIEKAAALKAKLFLTCDCGVKAHEQVQIIRQLGMEVIITDHHEVGETLPEAIAIINPHRTDSVYPFKDLCGVGVVFKLCEGITQALHIDCSKFYRAFLDLAAIGTIADVVPLRGENRILVHYGLKCLSETQKLGLRALLEISNGPHFNENLKAWHIGFRVGPRINAVGRLEEAKTALDLLLTSNPDHAYLLADELDQVNTKRKQEQELSVEEAFELIQKNSLDQNRVIVVSSPKWHPGVIGLISSKISEKYYRPSLVISEDLKNGIGKGSARSIPGFHLANALKENESHFLSSGGHEKAAGFSLELYKIREIQDILNRYAEKVLESKDLIPSIRVDAEVQTEEVDFQTTEELELFEPFGEQNPEPLLLTKNMKIREIKPTSNPHHVRLTLESPHGTLRKVMAFGFGEQFKSCFIGKEIHLLYTTSINTFKGTQSLQWFLKDFEIV